ncbi:MAG: MAPEG family protein [Acidiferrobacteraceae bacterium]
MKQEWIFVPMLAQVLLTALVWAWMNITRVSAMLARGIEPQQLASREQHSVIAGVAGPSDNLQNLFEVPVLFFTGVLAAYVTALADDRLLVLAWLYVGLRWLHSVIHISYHRVTHRYGVHVLSTLVLWGFWTVLAARILYRL